MFKTKLEKFIVKRSLIFFIILAILDIVLVKNRWYALIGLFIGGVFSILKFCSFSMVFSKLVTSKAGDNQQNHTARNSFIVFFINQILLLPLLFMAFKLNQWFFIGLVAGILLVPLVLLINSITEPLKITHNNFE